MNDVHVVTCMYCYVVIGHRQPIEEPSCLRQHIINYAARLLSSLPLAGGHRVILCIDIQPLITDGASGKRRSDNFPKLHTFARTHAPKWSISRVIYCRHRIVYQLSALQCCTAFCDN